MGNTTQSQTAEEITLSAEVFEQLRERNRHFDTVLRAIPDLIIGVDVGGHITFLSQAAAAYVHSAENESAVSLGETTLGSLARFDPVFGEIAARLLSLADGVQVDPFELRSEVTKRDFLVTISATDEAYVVVMRDISSLRDLSRFKDEIMKLASHDLRSPLALIIGYASLIALDLPAESSQQDYVNSILQATERMTGLLDAVMTVEQLRSSPLELNSEANFPEVVHEALNNLRGLAEQKSQTLDTELALHDMPPITINRMMIREVIENLLGNAVKYSGTGSTIWLKAWYDADKVYVTVRDQGFGIAAEQIPRIFEAFYRGKQPSGQKSDGRGLGLWLVKTIVQRHKGDIWVESEIGKGSLFGFWLPLR
ncbi:MAG: PAS domain-containing sensor histidine kinase [Anaerolineae bacterium]|nr:PAS domain-containing sensor histidine kinase [Anaerolineae bacterium]NUQ03804.1 hypothetical protein [Anaerolineae bacterium]